VPRLVQVAAMKPQGLLLGGLPHVALLALPRPRILGSVRPETPTLTDLGCNLRRDQIRCGAAIGRPVAQTALANRSSLT
jgi:hypothetical protein